MQIMFDKSANSVMIVIIQLGVKDGDSKMVIPLVFRVASNNDALAFDAPIDWFRQFQGDA